MSERGSTRTLDRWICGTRDWRGLSEHFRVGRNRRIAEGLVLRLRVWQREGSGPLCLTGGKGQCTHLEHCEYIVNTWTVFQPYTQ